MISVVEPCENSPGDRSSVISLAKDTGGGMIILSEQIKHRFNIIFLEHGADRFVSEKDLEVS